LERHNQHNLEILAPAGSQEALEAAVRSGATAVYLGGSAFSARASAHNFDNPALKTAVEYCHARGVTVHLAVNTILMQEELEPALRFIQYACSLPVDAVIIQDLGLLFLLRLCAPDLPLHASTQMSIHSPAGAKLMAQAGIERVVLSRELSLPEIQEIAAATPVQLEHFVHGALCMSVSGQCYFSSMLGSRSGNRGSCAQPCRLPFASQGGTGYDLSLKDLTMIHRIEELSQAGVTSCKIEGRMKRPEYVAAASTACRIAAAGEEIPAELSHNLNAVFSRSGFTTGYPDGALGRDMFGTRRKEDVTGATNEVFSKLKGLYKDERQSIPVHMHLEILEHQPICLTVCDEEDHTASVEGPIPEAARNRAIDEERCRDQLQKTGGTPCFVSSFSSHIAPGLSIPISALNQLRRQALDDLLHQREHRPRIPFVLGEIPAANTHKAKQPMALRARFAKVEQAGNIPQEANCCELLYVPLHTKPKVLGTLLDRGFPLALEMPRGMFGREQSVRHQLETAVKLGISQVWAGNLGSVAVAKELGLIIHGGFSLNVTNTAAAQWLDELGVTDTELSLELTLAQCKAIGGGLPRGIICYGRLPLMLCRNCPAANAPGGCRDCAARGGSREPLLTDRKGVDFPIQCVGSCSEVLNSVPLSLSDRMGEVTNLDFGVFRFTVENPVETVEIFQRFHAGEKLTKPYTRGLFYRGLESWKVEN
jgi:putative protease